VATAVQQRGPLGRGVALGLVVLLHVVVIYAFVTGLARRLMEVVRRPIETRIIEESKPVVPDLPPPARLPTPKFDAPPPPYIPLPEVRIQQPQRQTPVAISTPVKPEAPTPPPVLRTVEAPPHVPVHTPPVIDAARDCEKPEYPPAARRLRETGIVVLRILVGVDGSVVSSEILSSSGSKRLDEAARQGLSLCQFRPGKVDGKPEPAWTTLRYAWKLEG